MSLKTMTVTLKDGTRAVINASDYDPAKHVEGGLRKPRATTTTKKRKPGRGF
jgi:hypothetical protein